MHYNDNYVMLTFTALNRFFYYQNIIYMTIFRDWLLLKLNNLLKFDDKLLF